MMQVKGPHLTLLSGLVLGAVLFGLSANAAQQDDEPAVQEPVVVEPTPTAPGTPTATTPAPAPDTPPPTTADAVIPDATYAGNVEGGGASIAIVIKGESVVAYVCDGASVEAWFQGTPEDSSVQLTGRSGNTLEATYRKKTLIGTVTAGSKSWDFQIPAARQPSGLYRSTLTVRQAEVVGGWIVVDGDQVGLLTSDAGTQSAAPAIDLDTGLVTIDGVEVRPEAVDGSPLSDPTN